MEVVLYATFAGLPCLCVPAGFGANGLPMGLQLIGRAQGEWGLLQLGKAYETATASMLAKRPPGLELPLP
jgi:amidase